jgi:FMN phosphatase YigB (HAD superfamily)
MSAKKSAGSRLARSLAPPGSGPEQHAEQTRVVFLFDVDNTLLDNDRIVSDLKNHLIREVGSETMRGATGKYSNVCVMNSDMLIIWALCNVTAANTLTRLHLLGVSRYLIDYPFANRLFPSSLDVIDHVQRWGQAALLTDGDVVFQPRKVERSGLNEAVGGRVLIYVHKETELADVAARYPAARYVVVDDNAAHSDGD